MQSKTNFDRPIADIIRGYTVSPSLIKKYDETSLISAVKKIQESRLLPSEVETKNNALRYATNAWFFQRMRERYEELSPEIFTLERELTYCPEEVLNEKGKRESYNGQFQIKIPMLLSAEMGKDSGWKKEFSTRNNYDKLSFSIFSRMPPVPQDVRQAGKEAMAYVHEIFGEALTTEELGDVIVSNPEYVPNPSDSKLLVLWKPRPLEIQIETKIVDRDPALVLKCEKPYLVKTWSIPEEEPFMNIVNACKIPNLGASKPSSGLNKFMAR